MFRLKMPQTWSDTSRGFVKITVLWSPAFCRWPDFLSIMSCLCCHRQSWTYPKVFLKRPSFVGKNNAADWLLPIKTISSLSREMSRLPFLKYQFCCRHKLHWKLLDTLFKFTRVWGFWRFGGFFATNVVEMGRLHQKVSRGFLKNIQWCHTFKCLAVLSLQTPPPSPPPPDMKVRLLPCNVSVTWRVL